MGYTASGTELTLEADPRSDEEESRSFGVELIAIEQTVSRLQARLTTCGIFAAWTASK